MAAVEIADAGVVLHDQGAARRNVIQQLLVVGRDIFLRVVGADAENDGSVLRQIFAGEFFRRKHGDINSDLLQHGRNFISRARDVGDLQILWDFHIHDADALHRRLIVVGAGQVFARDQRVAFAVSSCRRPSRTARICTCPSFRLPGITLNSKCFLSPR